jgi:hypothetical protein
VWIAIHSHTPWLAEMFWSEQLVLERQILES